MIRGQESKIIKRLSACWSPCMHGEIYIPVDQDKQEAICNPRKMTFLLAFLVSYFRSLWMFSSINNRLLNAIFIFQKWFLFHHTAKVVPGWRGRVAKSGSYSAIAATGPSASWPWSMLGGEATSGLPAMVATG